MTINLYHVIVKFRLIREVLAMTNLVLFLNSFMSYLLLVAVFVLVIGVAVFIGIKLRRNKNAKEAAETSSEKKTGATNEI